MHTFSEETVQACTSERVSGSVREIDGWEVQTAGTTTTVFIRILREKWRNLRHWYIHVHHRHLNEICRRKKERSKQGHTNNKAKQHNTSKAVTLPQKKELPRAILKTECSTG